MITIRKPRLVSCLIVGIPIAAFLIINAVLVYRSDREIERRLEAMRAEDSLAEREQDSPLGKEARALLEGVYDTCNQIEGFAEEYCTEYASRTGITLWAPRGPYTTAFPYLLSTWPPKSPDPSVQLEDPIPTIRKAAAIEGSKRPSRQSLATTLRTLSMHTHFCLAKGRLDEVVEDTITALRLTDLYADQSIYDTAENSFFRTMAYSRLGSLLQREDVDPKLLTLVESALPKTDFREQLRRSIKLERCDRIGYFLNEDFVGRIWLVRAFSNHMLLRNLDEADALLADPLQLRDLNGTATGRRDNASIRNSMTWQWEQLASQRAYMRAMRILITLKRMENPDSLVRPNDTLDPAKLALPKEVTIDPFTGKPLIVRKKNDGWAIYSVGPDLVDDSGDVEFNELGPADVGIGPESKTTSTP